jgi:hypothetical protein
MEKKYIILILLIILLIILIKFTKCGENFESYINYRPLTTNYLNSLYTITEIDDIVLSIIFNKNLEYAKIYELEDIFNEKYYNIYLKNTILKYVGGDKIDFYLDSADNIALLSEYYKLYKTNDNKLFYKVKDEKKYLTIKDINVILTNDENDATIWNL